MPTSLSYSNGANAHFKCIFKDTPWCVFRQIVCKYVEVDKTNTHTHMQTTTHIHTRMYMLLPLHKVKPQAQSFSTPRWRIKIGLPPTHTTLHTTHTHTQRDSVGAWSSQTRLAADLARARDHSSWRLDKFFVGNLIENLYIWYFIFRLDRCVCGVVCIFALAYFI